MFKKTISLLVALGLTLGVAQADQIWGISGDKAYNKQSGTTQWCLNDRTTCLDPSVSAGDVVGPASSVDNEIALFDGITGKLLKAATETGLLKATAGVLAAAIAGTDYVVPGVTALNSLATVDNTLTGLVKAASGALSAAVAGTDYQVPITGLDTEVLFFDGANSPAGDTGMTYNKTTDALTAAAFIGDLTGNSDTTTTASAGDAALDFFGAGVTAATDATAVTDLEGTKLSITTGTLNVTETDSVVGAVTGIVQADGASNISAAVDGTDYISSVVVDTTPQLGGELDAQSNKIVSLLDPTAAQDAATKEYVDKAIEGTRLDLFWNDTASDIGGIYTVMDRDPTGEGESTIATAGLGIGVDQALNNYATIANEPGITTLVAGVYEVHFHAEKTAGSRTVDNIYSEFYKRAAGGTETLLSTSEDSSAIDTKADVNLHFTIASDLVVLATDRLVVKLLADVSGGGTDATVTIYQEGNNASRLEISTTSDVTDSRYFVKTGLSGGQTGIGGTGTGEDLLFQSNTSNDGQVIFGNSTTGLVYDEDKDSASIGGGTNQHTINGSVENSLWEFHQDGSVGGGGTTYHRHTNTADLSSDAVFLRSRGDHATPTIVQEDDQIGHIRFAGYDGTDYAQTADIYVDIDGTPGSDDMPGRIVFSTSPDGSQTLTERMRIDSAGRVGIGTTSPESGLLEIDTATPLAFDGATDNTNELTFSVADFSTDRLFTIGDVNVTLSDSTEDFVLTYNDVTKTYGPEAAAGGGNVSNTGTPLDGQIPVWTDATTIEGTTAFTFDGTTMQVGISGGNSGAFKWEASDGDEITATINTSDNLTFDGGISYTFDTFGTGGTAFVEVVDDNEAGFLSLGRTTNTSGVGSKLAITDGGADNGPGFINLYADDGSNSYFWTNSADVFRTLNSLPADDDAGGFAIIDTTSGLIGAPAQQGTFDDVTLADDLLLADGAVVGITGNEVITFNSAGSINFTGATVDVDGAFTAGSVASDAAVTGTTATFSAASSLTLGTASSATGAIILKNSTNANNLTLQAGATGGAVTLTFPTNDGDANQFLQTNGSGVTSWAGIGVADLEDGTDGELITWDASGNAATVGVGAADQVLTSNGAGAAPTFQDAAGGGAEATQTDFQIGEAFAQGEAGYLATEAPVDASQTTDTTNQPFGRASDPTMAGQTFQPIASDSIGSVIFKLNKVASPTDNLLVKIYASNKTTLLGTSDSIAGSGLSTTPGSEITFTFASPVAVTASTEYFLELSRSSSLDDTNYYNVRYNSAGGYADGTLWRFEVAAWSQLSAWDADFQVLFEERTWMKLTDADGTEDDLLPSGYANASGSMNDTVAFNTAGATTVAITGSAAANDTMYLSNTAGEVQNTPGTTPVAVGRMTSDTEMLIVSPAGGGFNVNGGTGWGQITVDGASGGCMMFRDTDDSGWTECSYLNGTQTCSTDADGICDGS